MARIRTAALAAFLLPVCLVATACLPGEKRHHTVEVTGAPKPPPEARNIVQVLERDTGERFSALLEAAGKANLTSELESPGPVTLFAPTNAALTAALGKPVKDVAKEDLAKVLTYHVVTGRDAGLGLADLAKNGVTRLTAESKASLRLNATAGVVNDTVKITEIDAPNGIIFVVDRVLTPSIT